MRNLRLTKGGVGPRHITALAVAAVGVAVATAAIYPAEGAAARHRHHLVRAHARLEHHTLRVQGTGRNDAIALRLAAGNPAVIQVDLGDNGSADFSFPKVSIRSISVATRGGNDRVGIDDTNGAFTDAIPTRIDGGPGNDTIAGGAGRETLVGGPGSDTIDGNGGNDLSDLGPGDDSFVWDPGDGSDSIEGGLGADKMVFNGAAASETVDLSANGDHLRFLRNPGNITMDTHGVEQVDFNALGGADTVTVNDLTGTDVNRVNGDLAGTLGGATGDGQADRVVVNGTNGADAIKVAGDPSGVKVSGLHAQVTIQHQEPTDQLEVHGFAGADSIDASALAAGAIGLTLDGGAGNDTIAGGQGVETSIGGAGNDVVDGNKGNDTAQLGAGDDRFVWDPGDGSDVVEGGEGTDTEVFNGANNGANPERFALAADGNRVQLRRNLGNITMDNAGVETFDVNALGGIDVVSVNDLTGTDAHSVNVDLAGTLGGTTGDAAFDEVSVLGTNGRDSIDVSGSSSGITVSGLQPAVTIRHQEPTTDELDVHGNDGGDTIFAAQLAAQSIALDLVGGTGDDKLIGGQGSETLVGDDGNDTLDGGGGNDLAVMDAGDDTFFWDPGDGSDVVEGGAGADTMVFNGGGGSDQVDVSRNGHRLRFFRNPGNITMDTDGVEQVDFNALGGADFVTVNDLAGTDVNTVNVDLAGTFDIASGADRVVVNGTNGDDAINVSGDASEITVAGLAAMTRIFNSDANDRLDVNTLAGNDTVDSAGLAAGAIQLFVDGLVP